MSKEPTDLQIVNRELKALHCLTHPDVEWIGGVCAGIAYRLGWAPWVVRLIWVISILTIGVGIGVYLLLWLFIPNAPKLPSDYSARTGHLLGEEEE